jgi:hypothetical protein
MALVEDSPESSRKERRYRRFQLQFPVCLSFPSDGAVSRVLAVSRNVSLGGMLLRSEDRIPPHTAVSLTMNVWGPGSERSVRLLGEGEVVRVESLGPDAGFAIAIECNQPIREMQEYLPAVC